MSKRAMDFYTGKEGYNTFTIVNKHGEIERVFQDGRGLGVHWTPPLVGDIILIFEEELTDDGNVKQTTYKPYRVINRTFVYAAVQPAEVSKGLVVQRGVNVFLQHEKDVQFKEERRNVDGQTLH